MAGHEQRKPPAPAPIIARRHAAIKRPTQRGGKGESAAESGRRTTLRRLAARSDRRTFSTPRKPPLPSAPR